MIDLPDTASPLYEKVKDYILTNIGTGRWGKDRKLPSENELVVSLGVSRMTVHRGDWHSCVLDPWCTIVHV